MQVAPGHIVSFHYTLRAEAGAVLDSSSGTPPFTYLHGYQALSIAGLEEELAGHGVGEEVVLALPLAGQRAMLSVKVERVRPATPEEFRRGRPL